MTLHRHRRPRPPARHRAVLLALAALVGTGLVVLGGSATPIRANHGEFALEVYREVRSVEVSGGSATVWFRARLMTEAGTPPPNYDNDTPAEVDWEVEGGPGDGEGGAVTLTQPDASCEARVQTQGGQQVPGSFPECSVEFTSSGAGVSFVRAWVDDDGFDNAGENPTFTVEADTAEGRYAGDRDCDTEFPNAANDPEDRVPDADQDGSTYQECPQSTDQVGEAERDGTDVVSMTFASAALGKQLDCPETTKAPTGNTALVPCKVTDVVGRALAGVRVDGEHLSGANDPDDDGAPADYNGDNESACTSSESGICNVDVPTTSNVVGTAEICFWIDDDADNDGPLPINNSSYDPGGTNEWDGAKCDDEEPAAGAPDLANQTDRSFVSWENRALSRLDVNPDTARATVGSNHALVGSALDQFGNGWSTAITINWEVMSGSPSDGDGSTPETPDKSCATATSGDATGTCTVNFGAPAFGTDTVCVWFAGEAINASCNGESPADNTGGERIDVATINWVSPVQPPAAGTQGYTLVGGDGGIYNFGTSRFHGSTGSMRLNAPVIGMAHTPGGDGYWLVARDGGVFTFGNAVFHGSTGSMKLNAPMLGMEATPTGKGYWLFAADGGIFSFGDALFYGSTGNMRLNAPMIGMAATSNGDGYWLVAQDGGVFAFGRARFHGSTGSMRLNQPVFDMAPSSDDDGYWLVARDGGIFSFGPSAQFYGSGVGKTSSTVIGIGATPTRSGYWLADQNGLVMAFGDARWHGDRSSAPKNAPIVGFATVPPR